MARRKKDDAADSTGGGQVNFRADAELWQRLQATAKGLGVDLANLARMVIVEHLASYEERAEQARARKKKDD